MLQYMPRIVYIHSLSNLGVSSNLIGIIEYYLLPKESIMSEPNKAKMADISLHFKMLVKLVSFCKCSIKCYDYFVRVY